MREIPFCLESGLFYVRRGLAYQMRKIERPGCVFVVGHKGKIVLTVAFGSANLHTGGVAFP